MSPATRTGLAIIAAFSLLVTGWGPITRDGGAVIACVLAAGAVVGAGIVARGLRLSAWVALLLQVLVAVACAAAVVVLPAGPAAVWELREVLGEGIVTIQTGTAPLPATPAVTLALVIFASALALLADVLAIALERPAYALLPLLALYLVPALGLPGSIGYDQVVRFGVGVGLVLLASSPHLADRRVGVRASGWGVAAVVVVGALVLAAAAGGRVPISPSQPLGQDQLQMTDPSLDLRRNLTQGSPEAVLDYTTDLPTGVYLRLATLTVLDVGGFSLDAARVSGGPFPPVPGLREPGVERTTQVAVHGFESEWLPAPYAPAEVRAPGSWGFASETLDVMAMARPDRKTATRGISYEVRSVDVRPSADQVQAAGSTELGGDTRYIDVPRQLPARIRSLAQSLTEDAGTAGAKAQALEAYLRSDRFRYSTAQAEGDSMRTLDDFLFGSRAGYCEQFAGAMVAMARTLGLPARMAVGFTPGTYADGTWSVSSRDMHTWPEIWLDDWGWVAFEPTPSSGVPTATLEPPAAQPEPTAPTPSAETVEPTDEPSDSPAQPTPTPEAGPAGGPDAGVLLGWVVGLLAALAAAATPGVLRMRRRSALLAEGQPPRQATLAAWEELRGAASDLGVAWPDGSPRYAGEELAGELPDAIAEDVRELALATERAMFDRPDAYAGRGSWGATVRRIEDALRAGSSWGARAQATAWPRSLWRR